MRKIFDLPSDNGYRFSFNNLFKPEDGSEKDNYIYWKFHSLECVSTYTFLANIFRRIDKMFEVFFKKCPYPKFKYDITCSNLSISNKDIENINAKLNDASSKWVWPYCHMDYDVHLITLFALKSDKLTDFIDVTSKREADGTYVYSILISNEEICKKDKDGKLVQQPSICLSKCHFEIKCSNDKELNICGGERELATKIYESIHNNFKWPYEDLNEYIVGVVKGFLGDFASEWDVKVVSTGKGECETETYRIDLVYKPDQK